MKNNKVGGSTGKTIQRVLTVLVLFIGIGITSLFAADVTFFGPKQYSRNKGKPVTETDTFICPPNYTGPGFKLRLINGDSRGDNRVSSAVVKINGVEVMGPSDFNRKVGLIERIIDLTANNEISVKLNSKPGSFVIIDIYKYIPEPEVTFSANPGTIQYQEFSTLSWNVLYADSISIDNGIGSVVATGSLQVSPEVPLTNFTLLAKNLGGVTSRQVSVEVIFPVPTVTLQASPLYIKPGNSLTLTWTSFAAHTVTIEPGIGNVELKGSRSVSPTETTIFTITAVGYGGTQTAAATVTVDGIKPVTNVTEPVDGSYLNSPNVVVKGQVMDSSPVTLKINNSDVPLQPENYFEVPLPLNEGANTIRLYAEDAAGNLSTRQVHVVVDTTDPQVQITAPQNNAVIREIPITVTGTFTEINPLKILLNNTIEGTINGDGFTFENVTLVEGENRLPVRLEDKAGNTGSASIVVTYIPDSEPPELTIASPESGEFLDKANVTVIGTVIDKSDILYVRVNGTNAVIDTQNNTYTVDLPLAEGENTLSVESEDEYQNKGSIGITVTVDTTAPQITVSSPQSGSITNKEKLTITGSITDAYPHQVTLSGGSAGSVEGELIGSNFYFKDIVLSEGENAFTVVCQDRAGNSGQFNIIVVRDSQA
ncbi:MAG: Ig-like domain-containing protein, partial [Candidatus Aminicenantes bacterium]